MASDRQRAATPGSPSSMRARFVEERLRWRRRSGQTLTAEVMRWRRPHRKDGACHMLAPPDRSPRRCSPRRSRGAYLVWAPPSPDLAAQTFRADLFADHGFADLEQRLVPGHYLLAYSVLYPPLGAWLGPRLAGALAVAAAAALRRPRPPPVRRPGADRHAVVRGRRRDLAADRADHVPARRSVGLGGAARPRPRPPWPGGPWPPLASSPARSPGCSSPSPGAALGLAGDRARGAAWRSAA